MIQNVWATWGAVNLQQIADTLVKAIFQHVHSSLKQAKQTRKYMGATPSLLTVMCEHAGALCNDDLVHRTDVCRDCISPGQSQVPMPTELRAIRIVASGQDMAGRPLLLVGLPASTKPVLSGGLRPQQIASCSVRSQGINLIGNSADTEAKGFHNRHPIVWQTIAKPNKLDSTFATAYPSQIVLLELAFT